MKFKLRDTHKPLMCISVKPAGLGGRVRRYKVGRGGFESREILCYHAKSGKSNSQLTPVLYGTETVIHIAIENMAFRHFWGKKGDKFFLSYRYDIMYKKLASKIGYSRDLATRLQLWVASTLQYEYQINSKRRLASRPPHLAREQPPVAIG